jgi:hypothetical protein
MKLAQALILSALIAGVAPAQSAAPVPRPNLQIRVSDWLVNAVVEESQDEVQPVQDCILGTWFTGLSRSHGQVHAELVPDPHHGTADIVLSGSSYSETIGFNADIRISAAANTPYEVRKRLSVDGKQLHHDWAHGAASSDSEILAITNSHGDVCTPTMIVARARAYSQKREGDAISADLARCRLEERFDRESYPYLVDASRNLAVGMRRARDLGLAPQPFEWSTTAQHMDVKITVPAPSQPAVTSAPAFAPGADVSVAVQQSLINELIHIHFASKTFSLPRIADLLKEGLTPFIPTGELDQRQAEFNKFLGALGGLGTPTLTFADKAPVTIAFADGGFTVTVHGVRIKAGDVSFPAVDFKLAYRIERTATSFAIVRQGTVQLLPRPGSNPVTDAALRAAIQPALNLLFVDRLNFSPLALTTIRGAHPIRITPLPAEAREGWLVLSWMRQEKSGP